MKIVAGANIIGDIIFGFDTSKLELEKILYYEPTREKPSEEAKEYKS